MKKEVLIAIVLGFIIGLIITFGIYRAQKAYRGQLTQDQMPDLPTPDAQTSSSAGHQINITSPQDETIYDQEILGISGSTTPLSYVTAVSSQDQAVTQAAQDGTFSLTIELTGGGNIITVTAIDSDGQSASQDLTITYSTADLDN